VLSDGEKARLQMLKETANLELLHLQQTNQRLFALPWAPEDMANKMQDIDFAERVDAFVARFGRLQDLLGDKYLPAWLRAVQEPVGTALENLDRAEKLGLVQSADAWVAVRKLRNQLVHEYVGRMDILHEALFQASKQVNLLAFTAHELVARTTRLLETE
jgi:hypothetical protein